MKQICYVFCHGFGFDRSFWRFLEPYFEGEETFYCDIGYFGAPYFPNDIHIDKFDYVGVGHSLGLIKLLALPVPWRLLIGLDGFINFLGYDPELKARRTREWKGLCRQFNRSPIVTLQDFYARAGVDFTPSWEAMQRDRLREDLESLAQPVTPRSPILFLASKNDVIVTRELLADHIVSHPDMRVEYQDEGKHNLGYVLPEVVQQRIKRALLGLTMDDTAKNQANLLKF